LRIGVSAGSDTKRFVGGSMSVLESDEFKTSEFFCKTDFDIKEAKNGTAYGV